MNKYFILITVLIKVSNQVVVIMSRMLTFSLTSDQRIQIRFSHKHRFADN